MSNLTLAGLGEHVGKELGLSDWVAIDQQRIDTFASCTGDHQWIHVDVERARRESPFRGPIAHGYLTLAMVAPLAMQVGIIPRDAAAGSIAAARRSGRTRTRRKTAAATAPFGCRAPRRPRTR